MDSKYISTKAVVDIGKDVLEANTDGVKRISVDAKEIVRVKTEEYCAELWKQAAVVAASAKPPRHTVMANDIE